jgi:hypothetical protein
MMAWIAYGHIVSGSMIVRDHSILEWLDAL